ncbi:hypothetical protein [Pandoravirus japonicus]|uniref:Uncharacterized protein n=1 Tax=Pandoravirus japonicus TaxID=2823154 RepID=A0A811BT97_9VIRU|nr:hypothetical protein [Pandoravirus japonicus]
MSCSFFRSFSLCFFSCCSTTINTNTYKKKMCATRKGPSGMGHMAPIGGPCTVPWRSTAARTHREIESTITNNCGFLSRVVNKWG